MRDDLAALSEQRVSITLDELLDLCRTRLAPVIPPRCPPGWNAVQGTSTWASEEHSNVTCLQLSGMRPPQ